MNDQQNNMYGGQGGGYQQQGNQSGEYTTHFINGLSIFPKKQNQPAFVLGEVVLNPDELFAFIQNNPQYRSKKDGKIRMQMKVSKANKLYLDINVYGTAAQDSQMGSGAYGAVNVPTQANPQQQFQQQAPQQQAAPQQQVPPQNPLPQTDVQRSGEAQMPQDFKDWDGQS